MIPFVHLIGITLGIIALSIGTKKARLRVPGAKAGIVLAIIGISLGVLAMVIGVILASMADEVSLSIVLGL